MDIKTKIKEIQVKFTKVLSGQLVLEGHQPTGKFEKDEQPLGILKSPLTRSLYNLSEELSTILEAGAEYAVQKVVASPTPFDIKVDFERELSRGAKLAKAISSMFWVGVIEEFPQVGEPDNAAGIRKDWQVVIELDLCECVRCTLRRALETVRRGDASMSEFVKFLQKEMTGPNKEEYAAIFPPELVEILSMAGELVSVEELLARAASRDDR